MEMELERLNEKKKLRDYYQQIKRGKIVIEDVPEEYRLLLIKYYGVF